MAGGRSASIKSNGLRTDLSSDIYLEIENEADPMANFTVYVSLFLISGSTFSSLGLKPDMFTGRPEVAKSLRIFFM